MKRSISGRICCCLMAVLVLVANQPGLLIVQAASSIVPDEDSFATSGLLEESVLEDSLLPNEEEEPLQPETSSLNEPSAKTLDTKSRYTPAILGDEAVTIVLDTYPRYIPDDGKFALKWEIKGLDVLTKDAYSLELVLSSLSPEDLSTGTYDPKTSTISLPLATTAGEIKLAASLTEDSVYSINARLLNQKVEITKTSLTLERYDSSTISKDGGTVEGLNGTVTVTFAKDTLSDQALVWVKPVKEDVKFSSYISGNIFEVTAQSEASKTEIHTFAKPLQFSVKYDEASLTKPEEALSLYTYNEAEGNWEPLYSWIDAEANILYAYSDHLSYFATGLSDFDAARPPFIENIQTGGFSGSATYAYPLQLPPGPGGLQPSLTLSYNSQVVDESTSHTQASWVGMGWSLDGGRITRNSHGTPDNLNDDTYSISMNGLNGNLLKGADGYYHTTPEAFWRIEFNTGNNTWVVLDKTGSEYTFTAKAYYPRRSSDSPCDYGGDVTYLWGLSTVKNAFRDDLTISCNITMSHNPDI